MKRRNLLDSGIEVLCALLLLFLGPAAPCTAIPGPRARNPSGPQDPVVQAREAEQKRDFRAAAALYEEYLKRHPGDAAILQRLGLVESLSNQRKSAIPPLQKALQLDPSLWGSALYLGISYYRTARFKDAVVALKRSLELKPGVPETEFWLGCSLVADHQPEPAVQHLIRAQHDPAWELQSQNMLVKAYQKAAEESYHRIAVAAPDSARVHLVQAQLLRWKGVNNGAIWEARQALRRDPDLEGAHRIVGEVYWQEKGFDLAAREFEAELRINALDGVSNLRLGEFRLAKAEAGKAIPYLKVALQQHAGTAGEAEHFLGEAEFSEHDYAAATVELQQAVEANPGDPANHQLLAQVYRATGQSELAAREDQLAHASGETASSPAPSTIGPNR